EGPPALALGALFRERWRRGTGEAMLAPTLTAATEAWPEEVAADFRDIAVGLARTAPAWRGQPEVRENERLYLAAIAAARHCIYLESQYLTSPVIAEALGQRLAEPDGPEIVLISTRHSPSYFDRLTMDRTRGVVLRRLRQADTGGRLKAYSPVTARGRAIIVHAKVAIIDDRLLRVGSSNLNNRSTGLDSECDLALEASRAADRQRIGGIRDRLVGHWLGVPGKAIADAVAASGGLGAAIEAFRGQGRERLVPIAATRAGPLSILIAAFHLGDPVSTADSWRPWTRRRVLRRDLMRAADRLALDRMPHPHDMAEEELV
ncbi:MAG: phospholipase D-like domain-containing protein, partial [Caulobacteraceae bacterium]